MGRPIFFLVNDREQALRELAGALDRRFGADYQILSEQSPDKALIALARLAANSERVALLIGAPRIAGSDGVEFLVRAHQLHPGAKRVMLIGRGEWAAASAHPAVHLARYARSVTLLVRGDALASSMSDYLVREVEAIPNVAVRLRTEVAGGEGQGRLERITLRDRQDGVARTVPAAGLFIMVGGEPRTGWLARSVQRDRQGYVLTGRDLVRDGALPDGWPLERAPSLMETSVPGVFAVGDVRAGAIKRVASAAGAGAIAVQLVHEYLNEQRG